MRSLLLLSFVLGGCGSATDGTYLMTARLVNDSTNPDNPQIGQDQQVLVSLYHTNNSLVLDLDGPLLVGDTPKGKDFEVSYELGTETSYDGCTSDTETQSGDLTATFGSDLGFDGNLTTANSVVSVDCPGVTDDVASLKYSVSAMRLDAAPDRHPTGSIAWGYFPSGGGY